MANDPNTIQYVIQEDGFWYIASKEKNPYVPELTVSAKGVANGLSTEYNDGYDFGPDSYNPSVTSGVPLTQTSGIQEAINYGYQLGVATIELISNKYLITQEPIEDPNNSGTYYQIGIPYNSLDNIQITLQIIGIKGIATYIGPSALFSATRKPLMTTLVSQTSSTNTYWVLYALGTSNSTRGGQSNVTVFADGIAFETPAVTTANGCHLGYCIGISGGMLSAWTTAMYGTTALPTDASGTAFYLSNPNNITSPGNYGGGGIIDYISVQGFNVGVVLGVAVYISYYTPNFVGTAVIVGSKSNDNPYPGYFQAIGTIAGGNVNTVIEAAQSALLFINMINMGDNTTASGYFYTQAYFISVPSGVTLTLQINKRSGNTPLPPNNIVGTLVSGLFSSTAGTTAGTVFMDMPFNEHRYKKYIITCTGYENDTTTNQSVDFPQAFDSYAVVTGNSTGLTVSVTTSGITITSPDSTTTYTGIIVIEGY